jgi:hypothetical protein
MELSPVMDPLAQFPRASVWLKAVYLPDDKHIPICRELPWPSHLTRYGGVLQSDLDAYAADMLVGSEAVFCSASAGRTPDGPCVQVLYLLPRSADENISPPRWASEHLKTPTKT